LAIIPSVLPADFAVLGEQVAALEAAGVDRIQWDVMDGRFVPNITFGADIIASARPHCSVPFEAHLMVHEPDWLVPHIVEAGCELVILHAEANVHLHRALTHVHDAGARAGVALNPATPVSHVVHVLDLVDLVLVMTVNPGFGGQSYIATMEAKVREVARLVAERGLSVSVEVDGGIDNDTVGGAVRSGANYLVAGSALFTHPGGLPEAVAELRSHAESARAEAIGSLAGLRAKEPSP
jgi:ribulose-phosphate 3-epimerase